MKIRCIIIEDEFPAQEKLAEFIQQVPLFDLAGVYDNAIEALTCLSSADIDLIFLDIQMPKINGIQFLETLSHIPQIVIVSAFDQYALKGYEYSVTDYLLKPYSFERFMQAVEKVLNNQKGKIDKQQQTFNTESNVLFVKSGNAIQKVNIADICYVQGMKDYQMIVSENSKIMALQNFNDISKVLCEPEFIRIHKSYIVALSKIDFVERNRIKIKDQRLPISATYKEYFYEALKNSKHLL
jgi:two-component system LytT family response regulator